MTWYAVRVTALQERFVAKALGEAGIVAYMPLHVTEAPFARRIATRTRPLIPGYVFAEIHSDDDDAAARAIRGVIRGPFIRIPQIAMGSMFLFDACHAFDETWKPTKPKGQRYERRWKPGDVALLDARDLGLLEGHRVTILRTKNKNRLDVLLTIFGRSQEIEIGESQLTPDVAVRCAA